MAVDTKTIDTGRASKTAGSEGIVALWKSADALNKKSPSSAGGEWVPIRALVIDDTILPRERQNADAVEQYAQIIDQLPPIVVEKDTFRVIDGIHRIQASTRATRDHVRIIEIEAPADELVERAFEANSAFGVRLTNAERKAAGMARLKRTPAAKDDDLARWAGVHRSTVIEWRKEIEGRETKAAERAAARDQTQAPPAAGGNGSTAPGIGVPKPVGTTRSRRGGASIFDVLEGMLEREAYDVAAEAAINAEDVSVLRAQRSEANRAQEWFATLTTALSEQITAFENAGAPKEPSSDQTGEPPTEA